MQPNKKFGSHQWLLLVILSIVAFFAAAIFSIQAPFFPAEAEKKNLTASEYGITFGIYGLTQFILSPFLGSLLRNVEGNISLFSGTIIAGSSTVLFGLLNLVNNKIMFMLMSYGLRIFEAIGVAILQISTFSFTGICFPNNSAKSFAIVETMFVLGLSIGPSIGAAFFNIGGFTLPFLVIGLMNLLMGGISWKLLPASNRKSPMTSTETPSHKTDLFGFIQLLKISTILLFTSCLVCSAITIHFIFPVLEPNLRQFRLRLTDVSLVFLVQGMIQAIFSFPIGYICDRVSRPEFVTFFGLAVNIFSVTLIGPSAFLPINPSLAITILSLAGLGLGTSAIIVPTFPLICREAKYTLEYKSWSRMEL